MEAYIFPGQGSQFAGMGKELADRSEEAKRLFAKSDEVLGFSLSQIMFEAREEELKQTRVTQPAIYVHSLIAARLAGNQFKPDMVAGHSLGEFSALAASGAFSFEDGLQLVAQRAEAMQKACEATASTMAAVVGLDDDVVEQICEETPGTVVAANYNCPGQLVISGELQAVERAAETLREKGALKAVMLQVGGAFHSPLMEPAREQLRSAIEHTAFSIPHCPIYQNVDARPHSDPDQIRENLIAQLTAPVRWTQTMQAMIADGATKFFEVGGNGKVLKGLLRRVDRKMLCEAI
ncbi:MAG: ACP S-malonyltransferase [Saprospiraceae bacterium]